MSELTNLLPASDVKSFKREYLMRVATVAILLVAAIVLIVGVLMLPLYLYETQSAHNESVQLKQLSTNLASSAETEVQSRMAGLVTKSAAITSLTTSATAGAALRAVLAVPRPGISLTGFTFTPPINGAPGNMQLNGAASTRENLRSYDSALGALPFVTSADLPISDYAKENDIDFTITLTGTLKP